MKVIIGLGNQGIKFNKTKHNAGFWVLDEFASRNNVSYTVGLGEYIYSYINKKDLYLMKPISGMNLSGLAVNQFLDKYNISLEDLIIVFDDVDLPLGSLRIKPKGGDGCHRGLKNIIYSLGSNKFARLRFGIGTDENMRPSEKYVLKPFSSSDQMYAEEMIKKAADALDSILFFGLEKTMNHFNT